MNCSLHRRKIGKTLINILLFPIFQIFPRAFSLDSLPLRVNLLVLFQ
jgi:hypothetical protein